MATIDSALLDEQIAALEACVEKCQADETEYLSLASSMRAEGEAAAIRLDALRSFRQLATGEIPPKKRERPRLDQDEQKTPLRRKKLKASAAIRELLAKHPEGMTRPQIIDAVAPRMDSIAKNPRHIVRTTIFNMQRSERLKYDENKEVYHLPS